MATQNIGTRLFERYSHALAFRWHSTSGAVTREKEKRLVMASLSNSKFAPRQHLIHLRFQLGARPDLVIKRLNEHMGPGRAKGYSDPLADTSPSTQLRTT